MTAAPQRRRRIDPFEILGIPPTSTPVEIKAAYRSLAKKYHPDLFKTRPEKVQKAAENRMASLNEAYKLAREGRGKGLGSNGYAGDDGPEGGRRSGPWQAGEAGAYSRSARRTESSAARAARMAASRGQAERAAQSHETQARGLLRLRQEARRSAQFGDAVARSKATLLTRVPSMMFGAGAACHTNELPCRRCRTIQRLPNGWQERLIDTAYFCSACDEVLLNR